MYVHKTGMKLRSVGLHNPILGNGLKDHCFETDFLCQSCMIVYTALQLDNHEVHYSKENSTVVI